jgi:hypothetical protein
MVARLISPVALNALLNQLPNNLGDRAEATVGNQPNVSAEIVGKRDRCRTRLASGDGIFGHAPLRDKQIAGLSRRPIASRTQVRTT